MLNRYGKGEASKQAAVQRACALNRCLLARLPGSGLENAAAHLKFRGDLFFFIRSRSLSCSFQKPANLTNGAAPPAPMNMLLAEGLMALLASFHRDCGTVWIMAVCFKHVIILHWYSPGSFYERRFVSETK